MKILGLQYLFDRCVDEEKIIIFGCGKAGQEILKQLHDKGIDPLAVFSNNPLNDQNNANDVHVQIPSNKFEGLKPLYVIAVIKEDYCYEMKKQLHSFGINRNRIITLMDMQHAYFSGFDIQQRKEHLSNLYRTEFLREINWEKPKKYSEKLNYEKLFISEHEKNKRTKLADKLLAKKIVGDMIGNEYLPQIVGVWENADDIEIEKLPESFVIKCNHGSGMNIVVQDKNLVNWNEIKEQLDEWLKYCYSYINGNFEPQYECIIRKIICEEFISGMNSVNPQYNVFCFGGQAKWICRVRSPHTSEGRCRFYNTKWETEDFSLGYPLDTEIVKRPDNLDEIISIAEKLSAGFRHVRVDLYGLSDGSIKFSELTFTPWSGLKRFIPDYYDDIFGNLILDTPVE